MLMHAGMLGKTVGIWQSPLGQTSTKKVMSENVFSVPMSLHLRSSKARGLERGAASEHISRSVAGKHSSGLHAKMRYTICQT